MTTPQDPPPAAQTPAAGEEAQAPGGIEGRVRAAFDRLSDIGLRPEVGIIVAGSFISFGGTVTSPRLGDAPVRAAFEAAWSVRGYQTYSLRFGLVEPRDRTTRLARADASVASWFNDDRERQPGLAVYLDAGYRDYPRMHFYGVGPGSAAAARADYGVAGTSMDVVVQWQPSPRVGVSGRAGVLDMDVGAGSDAKRPDVVETFDALTAPGLDRRPRLVTLGAGLMLDRRDVVALPTAGTFVAAAVWRMHSLQASTAGWTRTSLDVRGYRALGDPRVVLALRGLGARDDGAAGATTPFHLQYSLGGSQVLRGFRSYRFRGERLATMSAELRWRAHRRIEVAPLVDLGTVSRRTGRLAAGPLHVSGGLGVRVVHGDRIAFRLDWATGADGHRWVVAFGPAF